MTRKILLACGIAGSVLYVVLDTVSAMRYEGYSTFSQVISELSAVGAPTASLWHWLGPAYTLLSLAFAWGVWKSAGRNRPLRIVGGLLLALGFLGLLWPLGPMHRREVLAAGGGTWTDTLHIGLTMVTVPLMLVAMGFGAAAFGKRFRIYSITTMVVLLTFGLLTGLNAPRMTANLPTPWMGVWERINVFGYMLWAAVLAILLLRSRDPAIPDVGGGEHLLDETPHLEALAAGAVGPAVWK